MRIAHIEPLSYIYGPGVRFVIWTQGCSLHCKGCWNKEMWDFNDGSEISIAELFNQITAMKHQIEGITFLGGEPLDQFSEVLELIKLSRESGLSSMLFTGYEFNEIAVSNKNDILKEVDILITGRYQEDKRTLNHQWIGSTNQQIHFLTERYKKYHLKNGNYMEIIFNNDGSLEIVGFPPDDSLVK